MSSNYVKLFTSILDSTVWDQSVEIRIVWITMLAMSDRNGEVSASVPGLAKRAGVSREDTEKALASFLAPDPDSRTKDNEGRRIEVIDGGWRLLNHGKYRAQMTAEDIRAKNAERQRRFREKNAPPVTPGDEPSRNATSNDAPLPVTLCNGSNEIRSDQIRSDQINTDTEGAPPLPADAGESVVQAKGPTPEKFAEEIREVYEHWIAERKLSMPDSKAPKLDEPRKAKVRGRLKAGRTVNEIKRAITGCLRTKFNVEGGHTDLTLICRDDSKLEHYIAKAGWHEAMDREEANGLAKHEHSQPGFDWQKAAQARR